MLRRLHHDQPGDFAFTPANLTWAKAQITKFPEGREASAIIPLLWRAQEQEGWLTRPAIEVVADMLGLAYIRALEVASFYFMFQLQPVGSVAHIQVCGTTSCMICGAEDLIAVCKEKIAAKAREVSQDGKLSWEEVECLGACTNAPMAQIGKDYYEDLTADRFGDIIDEFLQGQIPQPGPQNNRFSCEPQTGITSLQDYQCKIGRHNASVDRALDLSDTVRRIDGSEVPPLTPWLEQAGKGSPAKAKKSPQRVINPSESAVAASIKSDLLDLKPATLDRPREAGADDLQKIKGVGPKLEKLLNNIGFFHFDQIEKWTNKEVNWVDKNLEGFKGRASRDKWVAQAKLISTGKETAFSSHVKTRDVL
jgi:NADH-quinone oxidoreductase subunit E